MLTLLLGCASLTGTTGTDAVASAKNDTAAPERMPLCINEFMPSNNVALVRPDSSTPDWVELHNPGDEDVSLDGWGITDDLEEPFKHPFDTKLVVPARGYLLLFASGDTELGDRHLDFKLSASGGLVALFGPLEDGQVVNYGTVEKDFSVKRSTDCCSGDDCLDFDFRGTPGFNNLATQGRTETFIFSGATLWSWSNKEHTGWTDPSFDSSNWLTGAGPLGFGDAHIANQTEVGSTLYFRSSFSVSAPSEVTSLRANLMVDDGARVWLNGVEALSENVPPANVDATRETLVVPFWLDPALLVEGDNVIAVEVHQGGEDDLTFDLSLIGERQ